ncbi:MAG: hypothetical protein ABI947_16290 [Chloroflexota bacterium]
MFSFDLLIPWFTLAAVLVPLLYVQRWIHRHLFGVGYLVAKEKGVATLLYYLFLIPGVFLHEFSHYMMAGVFGIRPKRFTFTPEAQEDGSLEMGFVQLEDIKNPVYGGLIGIAPLLSGMAVVIWITRSALDLPFFFTALQTTDLNVISGAVRFLVSKPDFLLWTYLAFAVANAMMPNAEDRRGWWIVGAGAIAILVLLTIAGFQVTVVEWLQGPIAQSLYSLAAIFGSVLALDLVAAAIIRAVELVLERATGNKVQYRPALPATTTATAALGAGRQLKSVYDLQLPLPPPPGKLVRAAPARLPSAGTSLDRPERPATPVGTYGGVSGPRPALGSPAGTPAPRPNPALSSPSPRPGISAPAASAAPGGVRPGQPAQSGQSSQSGQFGRPAQPSQPLPSSNQPQPTRPPIGGPPALARPNPPAPPAARPLTPTPAPKPNPAPGVRPASPFGARPAEPQRSRFGDDDDYIEADVIDDDDEPNPPKRSPSPFGSRPTANTKKDDDDDDELKYVDDDDL